MKFSQIYERLLAMWPRAIPIDDGRILDSPDGVATPYLAPNGGALWSFPQLVSAYEHLDDTIDHVADTWGSLMAWTMFQAFHERAVQLIQMGEPVLRLEAIERDALELRYFQNLQSEEWQQDLPLYQRS